MGHPSPPFYHTEIWFVKVFREDAQVWATVVSLVTLSVMHPRGLTILSRCDMIEEWTGNTSPPKQETDP